MGLLAALGGLFAAKKVLSPDVSVPKQETPAVQAGGATSDTPKQEIGVDEVGQNLKRRAKGKKGLMIASNAGSSVGGTGLNI